MTHTRHISAHTQISSRSICGTTSACGTTSNDVWALSRRASPFSSRLVSKNWQWRPSISSGRAVFIWSVERERYVWTFVYVRDRIDIRMCNVGGLPPRGVSNLRDTAYCIWSVISSFSNLNRWSSSLGLFCHVPLKKKTTRLRLEIEIEWHSKCDRLCIYMCCLGGLSPYRMSNMRDIRLYVSRVVSAPSVEYEKHTLIQMSLLRQPS